MGSVVRRVVCGGCVLATVLLAPVAQGKVGDPPLSPPCTEALERQMIAFHAFAAALEERDKARDRLAAAATHRQRQRARARLSAARTKVRFERDAWRQANRDVAAQCPRRVHPGG